MSRWCIENFRFTLKWNDYGRPFASPSFFRRVRKMIFIDAHFLPFIVYWMLTISPIKAILLQNRSIIFDCLSTNICCELSFIHLSRHLLRASETHISHFVLWLRRNEWFEQKAVDHLHAPHPPREQQNNNNSPYEFLLIALSRERRTANNCRATALIQYFSDGTTRISHNFARRKLHSGLSICANTHTPTHWFHHLLLFTFLLRFSNIIFNAPQWMRFMRMY